MAYRASAYFSGFTRLMPPKGQIAGTQCEILHTHVFDKQQLDTTDMLELFPIPAGARISSLFYASENLPAGNLLLGWTTGNVGDPSAARTAGTEFVNAVAHSANDISVPLSVLRLQNRSDVVRSLGMRASVLIGTAANRNITFRVGLIF